MSLTRERLENDIHGIFSVAGFSASTNDGEFGMARFTRDSLAVMDDLLETHPWLVRQSFSLIPQYQGIDYDDKTDQQPDRMPHQVAVNQFGGLVVPKRIVEARQKWPKEWGVDFDEEKGFVIWNQTDASRYISVLKRYVDKYGPDVLEDEYIHQMTGEKRTVREAALRQLDWMVRTIEASDLGLLEVKETNPRQTSWSGVMRDGYDSYFHEMPDGTKFDVNKNQPIAYLESQGLAVQAFADALALFDGELDNPEVAKRVQKWREHLHELPDRVFKCFASGPRQYQDYAPFVDRDENGKPRAGMMSSSVIGETLMTPELFNLKDKTIDPYELISRIAFQLCGDEFMTPLGIRMQGARHAKSEGEVWAYQGAHAVWPVTQWRIANGFDRVGFTHAAHDLRTNRALAALALTPGEYPEIWLVDNNGNPLIQAVGKDQSDVRVLAEQAPSKGQAWTLSGGYNALKVGRSRLRYVEMDRANTFDFRTLQSRLGETKAAYLIQEPPRYWVDVNTAKKLKNK